MSWFSRHTDKQPSRVKARARLKLEQLEDRITPVSSVSDLTGGQTATTLVQSLLGTGVQATNIKYTGANLAAGKFSGGQASIGFDQGVILSSGTATGVIGTNTNSSFTGTNNNPGDADLDKIVAPDQTFEAAVLEFDFIPASSVLSFQYVFSSEEYPEFVGSPFNDVFAFFLNGQNVALIPNTSTAVAINTVNAGSNAQFFVNNYTSPTRQTQMDGLTTVLTITATVKPGQPNHIKLAIADTSDPILDSNVFIKAGSFSSPTAPQMKVYNPLRFTFNKKTKTYDGLFTVINVGTAIQFAPFYVVFKKLPKGAKIFNVAGISKSGAPYIKVTQQAEIGVPLRVLVKIKNPLKQPFNSYLLTKNLQFSETAP